MLHTYSTLIGLLAGAFITFLTSLGIQEVKDIRLARNCRKLILCWASKNHAFYEELHKKLNSLYENAKIAISLTELPTDFQSEAYICIKLLYGTFYNGDVLNRHAPPEYQLRGLLTYHDIPVIKVSNILSGFELSALNVETILSDLNKVAAILQNERLESDDNLTNLELIRDHANRLKYMIDSRGYIGTLEAHISKMCGYGDQFNELTSYLDKNAITLIITSSLKACCKPFYCKGCRE